MASCQSLFEQLCLPVLRRLEDESNPIWNRIASFSGLADNDFHHSRLRRLIMQRRVQFGNMKGRHRGRFPAGMFVARADIVRE